MNTSPMNFTIKSFSTYSLFFLSTRLLFMCCMRSNLNMCALASSLSLVKCCYVICMRGEYKERSKNEEVIEKMKSCLPLTSMCFFCFVNSSLSSQANSLWRVCRCCAQRPLLLRLPVGMPFMTPVKIAFSISQQSITHMFLLPIFFFFFFQHNDTADYTSFV